MSRDPLDELFGPAEPEETESHVEPAASTQAEPLPETRVEQAVTVAQPEPVVASAVGAAAASLPPLPELTREELATEPVATAKKGPAAFLPWIIVGAVALVALIVALVFVSSMNGASELKDPDSTTQGPIDGPESPGVTEEPPAETEEPAPETPEADKPPVVDLGDTFSTDISYAGITVLTSAKLAPNEWYHIGGDTNRVVWTANIVNSFPESCADMRSPSSQSPWGIEQDETGTWVAVRPAETCAADPDLYNEMWGLMQAVADSAKPMGITE